MDGRLLRGGGIGRYLREVVGPWLAEPDVERVVFLGRPWELEPWLRSRDDRGVARVVAWGGRPYAPWAQIRWLALSRSLEGPVDVAFFPHYDFPLLNPPARSVVTIHDLTQFLFKRGFPVWKRWGGRFLLRGALAQAHALVTVSEASRKALVKWSPEVESRLHVIPNGVTRLFRPLSPWEKQAAMVRWGHLVPFALVLGPAKVHKNLELAVRVTARVREHRPQWRLVVVGVPHRQLRKLWVRAGLQGHDCTWIVGVDAPDDTSLRELYGLCEVFLFPSLAEGFGLPPLEAFACGARVLASRVSALEEVLGPFRTCRSLELLDPRQEESWAEAILGGPAHPIGPSPGCEGTGAADQPAPSTAGAREAPRGRPLPTWEEASRKTLALLRTVAGRGEQRDP